jgi:enamine deaminase RidA (YjgF/YER057c/UK114 family)
VPLRRHRPARFCLTRRRDTGDARDYDEMNRVWRKFFPVDPPTRTVCALQLSNGNGVEIECIAFAGKSPS